MEQKKRDNDQRRRMKRYLALYLYVLFALLLCTSMASYAWFSINRNPQVSNMNMYVTAGSGLELTTELHDGEWTTALDLSEAEDLKHLDGALPFLRQTSWSDAEQCFYGPVYGYDGRLRKLVSWFILDDGTHANRLDDNGYYLKATFYARSGQTTEVKLLDPVSQREKQIPGDGTYVIGYPDNTGKGPEVAVRLGLKMTYVDSNGIPLAENDQSPPLMYVYEPNADWHADGVTQGYLPTYSIHDPMAELVDPASGRRIIQNFTFGGNIGEFLENPTLFSLNPGQIIRIELYLWLEGQDADCTNLMSAVPEDVDWDNLSEEEERFDYYINNYRQIRANLQFTGTTEDQSGMELIPME